MGNSVATIKTKPVAEIVDSAAAEIGELYVRAKSSAIESVNRLLECGRLLIAKKGAMSHGEWLPWLADNETVLGFEERKAQRLIKLAQEYANTSLATDYRN